MSRGRRALGNYCHRCTGKVGRGVCTFSPQRQSDWYFGQGLRPPQYSEGLEGGFFFCAVLAVTRKKCLEGRGI